MSKEIEEIQKAWDKEIMTGPCHYCTAKKNIQTLLSLLEKEKEKYQILKDETDKYGWELKERYEQAKEKVKELNIELDESADANIGWSNSYATLLEEKKRLEERVKDLELKLSCHTSTCIADYEDVELRLKDSEAKNQIYLQDIRNEQKLSEELNLRIKELEGQRLLVEKHLEALGIMLDKAELRFKELNDAIKQAQEENPDEKHCTCVPLLKVKIKELEAELRKGPCCNLICHAEKLQLESQLASIKADPSIGKLLGC